VVLPRLRWRESSQQSEGEKPVSNLQTPDNDDKNNKSLARNNVTLVCDKCGAENWNLASEGRSHDQPADAVKGYDACAGVWRFPGVVIQFPKKGDSR
jgi:hypothetical protein